MAYAEQRAAVDYGVPSFVVADAAWAKNKGSTPAFSADGQIFFRETLPEKNRGMFAPHEVTHVMRAGRLQALPGLCGTDANDAEYERRDEPVCC